MRTLSSLIIWAVIGILVLMWLPLMALVWILDPSPERYVTGRLLRILASIVTRINPSWKIHISGNVPENPRNPYVVVANHQSSADIPVISRLPWEMKWAAKSELFDVPVFGWMLRLAGDIPVDPKKPKSRARVFLRARRMLENHCSVIFFPEGGRSRHGRIRPFTDGAFRLAVEAQVPILPIVLDGTGDAMPPPGWKFNSVDVQMKVLDPVPTAGLTKDDVPTLREQVRRMMVAQLAEWRGLEVEKVS